MSKYLQYTCLSRRLMIFFQGGWGDPQGPSTICGKNSERWEQYVKSWLKFLRILSSPSHHFVLPYILKPKSLSKNLNLSKHFQNSFETSKTLTALDFNGYLLLYGICLYTIDSQTLSRYFKSMFFPLFHKRMFPSFTKKSEKPQSSPQIFVHSIFWITSE